MICAVLLLVVLDAKPTDAVTAYVRIRVQSLTPPSLIIEGEQNAGRERWSFRNTYAGLMALGERIGGLSLTDNNGKNVGVRKLAPGEYIADAGAMRFRYEVNLDPPGRSSDSAYVSWLTPDRGLLMLGDLLPKFGAQHSTLSPGTGEAIRLNFEVGGWQIASVERRLSGNEFETNDPDKAVFFIAKDLRKGAFRLGRLEFTLASSGAWAFSDHEILDFARGIIGGYVELVGGVPGERALLVLSSFPKTEGPGRWSAETRGATVVLLSGKQPAKTAALAQLSTPLAHELFHLWVPNGLSLDGSYDWFFEGFTIYQAMRTSQRLGFLTFQEFLNAAARAFDAYSSSPERHKLSLVEASERRWTTSPALIYQKAMLVALLYDLTLRSRTKGKHSLDDVYRELFRRHRLGMPGKPANASVMSLLNGLPGMQNFAHDFVETASPFDLTAALAPFGLVVETGGMRTRVGVKEFLSRDQRDLLRRLGYNGEPRAKRNH